MSLLVRGIRFSTGKRGFAAGDEGCHLLLSDQMVIIPSSNEVVSQFELHVGGFAGLARLIRRFWFSGPQLDAGKELVEAEIVQQG